MNDLIIVLYALLTLLTVGAVIVLPAKLYKWYTTKPGVIAARSEQKAVNEAFKHRQIAQQTELVERKKYQLAARQQQKLRQAEQFAEWEQKNPNWRELSFLRFTVFVLAGVALLGGFHKS